ncbi:MAG: ABC transporter ATP-binding protein [Calditrichaceae bacterium]|nr:ABC transporter ATP-binding protein/permease [Calditrichia bacterium]NUQ41423.1 ABC transporter ATP-binding protein [Calditrichaceae bacterium]
MPRPLAEHSFKLYLRIISYLKPYYKELILVVICNFGYIVTSALSVWMIAPVITTLFDSAGVGGTAQQPLPGVPDASFLNLNAWLKAKIQALLPAGDPLTTLKWLCLVIFVIFLLKNLMAFLEFFWMTYVEQRVVRDLREELYERIINQSMSFFHKHNTGGLISNITNDINAVNVAVNRSFTKIIRDPIMIGIYLALLFSISWKLALLAITILPLSITLIRKVGNSLKRRSTRVQERLSDMTSVLQETISGIKVVKAFAMERYENEKFRRKTREHFRAVVRQIRMHRLSSPVSETMGVGVMIGVIWYGGNLILHGQSLHPEDFMRFMIILFSILDPIKSLGEVNNNIQIALASGQRIFGILDQENPIREKPGAVVKRTFDAAIEYEGVFFRYNPGSELVLKGVNLRVNKHEKIAFVGSSGAGKTTLVNLLPRFYDVNGGAIRIDGIDVRDMTLDSLRGLMGIVTQEVILFDDTVANNIAYGLERYSPEEIERAAKLANAYHFITELPDGFNTIIGERGMLLSGGQRQRLSIARAILKNPPILIFDEATSSLDSESEFLIQEAIENLMKDRTVFMIAHRLSSIVNSDKIVVLEDGQVIDEGPNEELLERSERYRKLYELQFNA